MKELISTNENLRINKTKLNIMKTVSESIYRDGNVVVAMALVQHIEKRQKPVYKSEHGFSKPTGESEPNGIMVVTKFTNYNTELDDWDNPIYIGEDKARAFISAWTTYRAEVENNIADLTESE